MRLTDQELATLHAEVAHEIFRYRRNAFRPHKEANLDHAYDDAVFAVESANAFILALVERKR